MTQRAIVGRVLWIPILLLGVVALVFALSRMVPGDLAVAVAGGERATPEEIAKAREDLELDKPLPLQFTSYLGRLVQGDLGYSFSNHTSVADVLGRTLPATLELVLAALLLGIPAGLAVGIWSATNYGTPKDGLARLLTIAGLALPVFWVGLVLDYIFSVQLGLLPLSGRLPPFVEFDEITGFYTIDTLLRGQVDLFFEVLRHLALPAVTLAIVPAAIIARFARAGFIDVLSENYIRTARAFGVRSRTITWRLAAKNAMLPLITVFGLLAASMVAGTVIVETVFSWPGVGSALFMALDSRDYALVQGITLVVGVAYILSNLAVDLSYSVLDPRIRRGGVG